MVDSTQEDTMALIVRLSILGLSPFTPGGIAEQPIEEVEIINRGRDPKAHPGASDHCVYEVRERLGNDEVGRTVWVDHARSEGARKLAERALRELRAAPLTPVGRVDARTGALLRLEQWASGCGGDRSLLEGIVDEAFEAVIEGRSFARP